ncbi:MAG: hypothetical protein QOC61_267, partial [Acidobacteriota bacterium]|nr:hypothetical protein [Acidobacteriota bacterium]
MRVALVALISFISFISFISLISFISPAVSRAKAAPPESSAAKASQTSFARSPSALSHSRSSPPASTLAQYRGRVHVAVAPLEELAAFCELLSRNEKPEVWSKEGFDPDVALEFPKRESVALGKVRDLLPRKERVEWGGSVVEVDNVWLYAALDDFERVGDNNKRAMALRGAAGRLRALEARLAELEGDGREATTDKDAERGRLNAILRDPEFNRQTQQQSGALQRLIDEFFGWLRDIFRSLFGSLGSIEPGTSPGAIRLAQIVVLALCLLVVAYVARRLWLRRGRELRTLKLKHGPRVILGERLEADKTAADLLDDAERLARAGDLRGAIRKAYVALLCELGDRGVVRLAQHKTNRDYLNAVRKSATPRLYTE